MGRLEITYRPLVMWPYPNTDQRRSRGTFKADWNNTMALLRREVSLLDGENVVIGGAWKDHEIRKDGMPRSDAREPHPGIEISFDAVINGQRRRVVYATDVCEYWRHNVRSIALGLESLRAVDRYGITRRGEQYAGFAQLTAGRGNPDPSRGAQLIREHGGIAEALKATHPDLGGNADDFADVQAAREAA